MRVHTIVSSVLPFFALLLLCGSQAQARVLDLPAAHASVRLLDADLTAPLATPALADDGGGAPKIAVNYNRDRFLSIFLAIIPGFGLGHFWANDTGGFITFLIVDVAVWTGGWLLSNWIGPFAWILTVAAKVWQVYDVVRVTGGAGGDAPDPLRRRLAALPATERVSAYAAVATPAFSIGF